MEGILRKLENILLFLFLLLIPTQLGRHFWPEWSYVLGIRVDYLSPTLYLLDVIWILLAVLNLRKKRLCELRHLGFFDVLSLLFVGINVLMAVNRWVAICRWLRIGQWLITINLVKSRKLKVESYLGWIIPIWIMFEGLLGLAQVTKGGSLNGIMYWLGERRFVFTTIGVAQLSVLGQGFLRAYGTFSHPNSLAGFILISLLLWNRYQNFQLKRILGWVVVWCGVLGIILAGSRAVWLMGILLIFQSINSSIANFKEINFKKMLGIGLVGIGAIVLVLTMINENYRIVDFLGGWDTEGVVKRMSLNLAGVKMIRDNPLFGVGAGNFLVRLPEYQKNNSFFWLQPAHNVPLLVLSEIGIVGLIIIAILLGRFKIYKLRFTNKKLIWVVILITGMVDHYWVTLPQNWWLLAVILGI